MRWLKQDIEHEGRAFRKNAPTLAPAYCRKLSLRMFSQVLFHTFAYSHKNDPHEKRARICEPLSRQAVCTVRCAALALIPAGTRCKVNTRNEHREQHEWEAHLHVLHEADGVAILCRDIGNNDVARRADERTVATEACAERRCPPQRRYIHARAFHGKQDRNHGCHERNIVEHRRDNGRRHEQNNHGEQHVVAREVHKRIREHVDGTGLDHTANDDEQAAEERERSPLDMQQRLRNIDARNKHDDGGGGKGDNRRLDAERAMTHGSR